MNTNIYILFIFIFAITLAPTHRAQGQYYGERNLSLGLSVNPSMSWLKLDGDTYSQEIKTGFSYGLVADIGFASNYYFATGLQINTLNHQLRNNQTSDIRDIKIQYAEVPLALKLKTDGNDLARFYALFGFTAGLRLSGKEKAATESNFIKSGNVDLFRLGLAMGAGAEWRVGYKHAIMTGVTFNNGFTRAHKSASAKNPYVALNLGFLF